MTDKERIRYNHQRFAALFGDEWMLLGWNAILDGLLNKIDELQLDLEELEEIRVALEQRDMDSPRVVSPILARYEALREARKGIDVR